MMMMRRLSAVVHRIFRARSTYFTGPCRFETKFVRLVTSHRLQYSDFCFELLKQHRLALIIVVYGRFDIGIRIYLHQELLNLQFTLRFI